MTNSCIYNGTVIHKRYKPKEHFFKYSVFSLFLDLSELEILNNNKHIDADLIDLRTLSPLDFQTIVSSVSKTNKVIICHEDTLNNSIASDISAHLTEYYFDHLDAPIMRIGSMNTPIPFNSNLEKQYLSKNEFETAILKLHRY